MITLTRAQLAALVAFTKKDDEREVLQKIHVESGRTLIATDGHRVARFRIAHPESDDSFSVPRSAAAFALRFSTKRSATFTVAPESIRVSVPSGRKTAPPEEVEIRFAPSVAMIDSTLKTIRGYFDRYESSTAVAEDFAVNPRYMVDLDRLVAAVGGMYSGAVLCIRSTPGYEPIYAYVNNMGLDKWDALIMPMRRGVG